MRDEILDLFRRFRRRNTWVRGWDLFLEAAFVMTVTVAAMLLVDRVLFELEVALPHLSRPPMVVATMAGALALAAVFASATVLLRPTPPAQIAWRLDRAAGGEERFLSALELAAGGADGGFARAVCRDAVRVARETPPERAMPRVPVGYRWGIVLSLAGAALLVGFGPQVFERPSADFDANPLRGAAPLEVFFVDGSLGALDDFAWDFGDGHRSSGEETTNVYEKPGVYAVRLTVRGPGGTSEKVREIEVLAPDRAVADFDAQPLKGRAPLEVKFRNLSRNGKAYRWDFGDGVGSTEPAPSHAYERPGLYAVRLKVSNDLGDDERIRAKYVKVAHPDEPLADFRALPREGDAPLTVQFEDQSGGAAEEWHWDFGDIYGGEARFSRERHPSYTYKQPGHYTVRLCVNGPHGEDEEEKVRYIHVKDPRGSDKGPGKSDRESSTSSDPRKDKSRAGSQSGRLFDERTRLPPHELSPLGLKAHEVRPGEQIERERSIPTNSPGESGKPEERPFREVYAPYRRAAEDSINRERIPPAVRETVRRYFESIRPQ